MMSARHSALVVTFSFSTIASEEQNLVLVSVTQLKRKKGCYNTTKRVDFGEKILV